MQGDNAFSLLPRPITLTDQSFSIETDILLGWVPKVEEKGLIALKFQCQLNDAIIEYYTQFQKEKLIYLGYRPINTGQLHRKFSSSQTYNAKNFRLLKLIPQEPFLGMNPSIGGGLQFDSIFESGNLDIVIQSTQISYDLFMRVDSNTKGHCSWFYFKVWGLKKGERYTFNICNFTKGRSLYERGMKPYVLRDGKWAQGGENVSFKRRSIRHNVTTDKQFNCLTFQLIGDGEKEIISVAYCVPYTYSQMLENVANIANKGFAEKNTLCQTLSGISVPFLTFQDGNCLNRKAICIQARIHPGEANGSWVMQGLLNFLSSPASKQLLSKCIVIVVPMLNPDGVILGNFRTAAAGRDLNRRFRKTDPILFPTVFALKQLIKQLYTTYGDRFLGFIDLHGHSVRKNVFLYGPEHPMWTTKYYKCRLLPKLLADKTPMFRYYSCMFRVSEWKKGTARSVFSEIYDLVNCFTIETSNGSFYHNQQTFEFTTQNWLEMGKVIGQSINELIDHLQEIDFLYQDIDTTKRISNRVQHSRHQIVKKKRSVTVYQEDKIKQIKSAMQNTKFEQLFEEMRNDLQDLSMSEGGSDSESSDDDYSESELDKLRLELIKAQPELKKFQIESSTGQNTKISLAKSRERDTPKTQVTKQDSKQTITHLKTSPKKQYESLIKQKSQTLGVKTYRIAQMIAEQSEVEQQDKKVDNQQYVDQEKVVELDSKDEIGELRKDYMDEYSQMLITNPLNHTQEMDSSAVNEIKIQRPSTAKIDNLTDTKFTPLQQCDQFHQKQFKGHHKLKSQQLLNKHIDDTHKIKIKRNPPAPLLQQLSFTKPTPKTTIVRTTNNNLEHIGILIKPNMNRKLDQEVLNAYQDAYKVFLGAQRAQVNDSSRRKANVPSSFYSVKKHLQNRFSVDVKKILSNN